MIDYFRGVFLNKRSIRDCDNAVLVGVCRRESVACERGDLCRVFLNQSSVVNCNKSVAVYIAEDI